MKEIITPFIMITEEIIKTTRATIQPFTEKPGREREMENINENSFNATDLFSFFTADIIKEKVMFTR